MDKNFNFGFDRSVETIETSNYPNVVGLKDNLPTIDITFVQMGYNSECLPVSKSKYDELCRLLYTTEPTALEVGGYSLYGYFTGLGEGYDSGLFGGVKLKFKLTTPYFTASKNVHEWYISGTKQFKIHNISTANGYNPKPEIKFRVYKGSSITITNKTNFKSITLTGLNANEDYIIFNEEKQIWSNSRDQMVYNSGDWIELEYGENTIEITATEGRVTLQYNPAMGISSIF